MASDSLHHPGSSINFLAANTTMMPLYIQNGAPFCMHYQVVGWKGSEIGGLVKDCQHPARC